MTRTSKPAAEQFAALGLSPADWTPAMSVAVKQRWTNLPVDEKVDVLRARLAAVPDVSVPSVEALTAALVAKGEPLAAQAAEAEHKRLKRNAAVNRWRARTQLQAALDARDAKFAKLRAKRGSKVRPLDAKTEETLAVIDEIVAPLPAPAAS